MMDEPGRPATASRLDGPIARIAAIGVIVVVAGVLGAIHWEDFFPPPQAQTAADDPVALCFAERAKDIDNMLAEGLIDESRSELFKQRAAAMCEATVGGGSGPPAPGAKPPLSAY